MKCFNRQFGQIEYDQKHVYEFAEGLIGFEHLKRFIVVNDPACDPFRWLVSVEDEETAFPILDPTIVFEEYRLEVPHEKVYVAVVAALKDPVEASTVNLRSPILFDITTHTAQQVVLDNEMYAIHHPLVQRQAAYAEQGG